MNKEARVERFKSLFNLDDPKDLDSEKEYALFFNDVMDTITTEYAVKMLFEAIESDFPLKELKDYLTTMFLTGISTFRYSLLKVKPELADAIREFEREYILGENTNE